MNGRMYDPVLGRMLSADNYMHSGTQGLNRYAYVYNNPLKYTDPSGEFEGDIGINIGRANYLKDVSTLDRASVSGAFKDIDGGYGFGGNVWMGTSAQGETTWLGAKVGIGLTGGVSYGVGNTEVYNSFSELWQSY
jgi:hypothetical protein